MSVNVILTPNFEREAKKLIKKYRSLRRELLDFTAELEGEPRIGVQISENVYKVRLAVRSKGKGKSGGMRIITYVEIKADVPAHSSAT
jgi:mRNA-degrading endonuclease RelE of RelBE toxin-antitoxin system